MRREETSVTVPHTGILSWYLGVRGRCLQSGTLTNKQVTLKFVSLRRDNRLRRAPDQGGHQESINRRSLSGPPFLNERVFEGPLRLQHPGPWSEPFDDQISFVSETGLGGHKHRVGSVGHRHVETGVRKSRDTEVKEQTLYI